MHELQGYAAYIDQAVIDYIADGQIETFESFASYDLVAFDWYDLTSIDTPPAQILIYIDKDDLFYICENEFSYNVAKALFVADASNEHAMYLFFRNLFKGSTKHLEQMENRVSALDDDVSDGTEAGLRERLIAMRNEVQRVKKYYEQLELLFEELCENDNGLLSTDCLKYFAILRNRSVRLASQALNLKESVTQVRESYQAQIGIEQNDLMKVFTLVTSIFLPLTLIAGWYGMNLKMPEFGWKYGYLFVAGLSLAVCVIWFAVFKHKKWFK
ncbi:MAG: CorA family divalent cation transporter [Clostridia bacterium]|nr:CorA family divalent cation transporter [Clostridia bacterium]